MCGILRTATGSREPAGVAAEHSAGKRRRCMSIRPVKRMIRAKPTTEGAGVHLRRAFGFGNTSDFDPFLLLDDFRNDVPEDYLAGFPWHPHRGIETITYVLAGTVEHGDSMGNRGAIAAGDVQWMTAGSGIIHQEMPKGDAGGADARVSAVGEPAVVAEDDRAAVSGSEGARRFRRSRTTMGRTCAWCAGISGARAGRSKGLRPIRFIWMCRCRRGGGKRCRWRRRGMRFAYVFAGAGKFCNASDPLAVPTEPVGWADTAPPSEAEQPFAGAVRSWRRSDGAGGRRWDSVSVGFGKAAGGAGGVVRADRDEHAATASGSLYRA